MSYTVYQAPEGFAPLLQEELLFAGEKISAHKDLFLVPKREKPYRAAWAQWTWYEAEVVSSPSIGKTAQLLKTLAKEWVHVSVEQHRRAILVGEQLRINKVREITFGAEPKRFTGGAYCFLSKQEILVSTRFSPAVAFGAYPFVQNKTAPSRAYLKLWEVFTRFGVKPKAGESCLDLGAAPGAWTDVLVSLGTRVHSVDRAFLAPYLMKNPLVTHTKGDAFSLKPQKLDWFFSDLICYPEKLHRYAQEWLASGLVKNFVCTIKFQGKADPKWIQEFRLLGGEVVHLSHNKHELTWIRSESLICQPHR